MLRYLTPASLVIIGGAALAFAATKPGAWPNDDPFGKPTFSECMLEQMRGQAFDMKDFALVVCSHRTGKSINEGIAELSLEQRPRQATRGTGNVSDESAATNEPVQ
jgi:hypothetical protein